MKTRSLSVAMAAAVLLALGMSRPAVAGGGYTTVCHDRTGKVIPCPISCEECLWLDTYNPVDPPVGTTDADPAARTNVATTVGALTLGQPYRITITGTYSAWAPSVWPSPLPANYSLAGSAPIYPSPVGYMTGPVGLDWEFLFCYAPAGGFAGNQVPVKHLPQDGISLDNGATFGDIDPDGCPGTLPGCYTTTHQYHYSIVGQGMQAAFTKLDTGPHSDNYGRFRICIQKLTVCGDSGCDKPSGSD